MGTLIAVCAVLALGIVAGRLAGPSLAARTLFCLLVALAVSAVLLAWVASGR